MTDASEPNINSVLTEREELTKEVAEFLASEHGISNLSWYECPHRGSGCVFFRGMFDKTDVFVKWGGWVGIRENEFAKGEILFRHDPAHFAEPFFFRDDDRIGYFINEFVDGETLENLENGQRLNAGEKANVIKQIGEIARTFLETRIVHRDCGLHNMILTRNGRLVLIDMDRAVDSNNYTDAQLMHQTLLTSGAVIGRLKFDDFPILLNAVKKIGCRPEYEALYNDVSRFLESHVGKLTVSTRWGLVFSSRGVSFFFKKMLVRLITVFVPRREWRRKLRERFVTVASPRSLKIK